MKYDKRQFTYEEARVQATRCFGNICCAPCNGNSVWEVNQPGFDHGACPITDIPAQNVAFASPDENVRTLEWWRHKRNNPLHLITGYSCNAPCMDGTGCITQYVERSAKDGNLLEQDASVAGQPVAIREIELAFSEWGYEKGLEKKYEESKRPSSGQKVVIVGSSAAGLTAGIQLLWLGWQVEIVSAEHLGLLMAIPDDHLPYDVALKPAEQFVRMGGKFIEAKVVPSAEGKGVGCMTVSELRLRAPHVILAPGTNPRQLTVPGNDLQGVVQTIPFLRNEKLKRAGQPYAPFQFRGPRCLHYGAGDTANDGARTVHFLLENIDEVMLAVRSELPKQYRKGWTLPTPGKAWIETSTAFREAQGDTIIKELLGENGRLGAAVLHNKRTGNTWTMELDHLFLSTGGEVDPKPWDELGVVCREGVLVVDESGRTGVPGVYACGDAVLKSHRVFPYAIETAKRAVQGLLEDTAVRVHRKVG